MLRRIQQLEHQVAELTEGEMYLSEEAAAKVGLKKNTLYRKFKRGVIPQGTIWWYNQEGRLMVNIAALRKWLSEARRIQ